MKSINTLLVIIVLFLLATVNGYTQVFNMHVGDTLSLDLATYRGKLQWQESTDSATWTDITGATYQPYIVKFSTPKYYRGKVTENSCNPIYTSVSKTLLMVSASITDIDGNKYDTIRIGTQVWFKQNLKTAKLNDGTSIPIVTDNAAWSVLTTSGRCYYNNDSIANAGTYGVLYNWHTVNTTKLCPTGYHVPTDAEWTTLTTFLGGLSTAGGKLKEVDTAHWNAPNSDATNETDFTALPGGNRFNSGTFSDIGSLGEWWSSTELDATYAWHRYVGSNYGNVFRNNYPKSFGYAVRCLRNY